MGPFDIVLFVPKADELRAVELALGGDFSQPVKTVLDKPIYRLGGHDLEIAIVTFEGQGNSLSTLVTDRVLNDLDPPLAFLLGTALGNSSRCAVGDVVLSESVTDYTESRIRNGEKLFRPKDPKAPTSILRREIGRFLERADLSIIDNSLAAVSRRLGLSRISLPEKRRFLMEPMAAGNDLIDDPGAVAQLWQHNDRLACYDMESAGFANCASDHKATQWMVIRGISDYGDPESRAKPEWRQLSAATAALLVSHFIDEGLKQCHPRTLRPPLLGNVTLPEGQYYTRYGGLQWFEERIKQDLNITLPRVSLGTGATLTALATLCAKRGIPREQALPKLQALRSEYFEKKYLNYSYAEDLRGVIKGWSAEVLDQLRQNAARFEDKRVLVVGMGNGLEAELYSDAASILAVDISGAILERAKQRVSHLETLVAPAESLTEVPTDSVDYYVSLRTYMSRFFDVRAALEEAYRVVRPGGWILISVSNGYAAGTNGNSGIVRGLKVPGTPNIVDPEEPFRQRRLIRRSLRDLGVADIRDWCYTTDAYLLARCPAA